MINIDGTYAKEVISRFVRRFDESYRLLAYYAALPLVLTPELLNYLRNEFLRDQGVPWVAEVDLLLSDLCDQVGYEQYVFQPHVRAYLIGEMRKKLGIEPMQAVARLLIQYVRQLSQTNSSLQEHELQAQQWAAMVYLDEHRKDAAREIVAAFESAARPAATGEVDLSMISQAELARLSSIVQELAPQLEEYPDLLSYAEDVSRALSDRASATGASERTRVVMGRELVEPAAVIRGNKHWTTNSEKNSSTDKYQLTEEQIEQNLKILQSDRQNLAYLLEKTLSYQGSDLAPRIREGVVFARNDILRIKDILRQSGMTVEDQPKDADYVLTSEGSHDGYQYDVFISYGQTAYEWVREDLVPELEAANLHVLVDYRDFEIGVPKLINIERAVDHSRNILVVLTNDWLSSEWAEFESLLAGTADPAGRMHKLIPLIYTPCVLPQRIASLKPVDFIDSSLRDEQMERLVRRLGATTERAKITAHRARIFISYKRDVQPDERVAQQIHEALGQQHDVFIDQAMPIGTHWAERIEAEIGQADFLIALLSPQSIHSEMVNAEIHTANQLAAKQNGRPAILPVRLNYHEPFQYPLSVYLDHMNETSWNSVADTPRLIANLLQAIAGTELDNGKATINASLPSEEMTSPIPRPLSSSQRSALDLPGGTMNIQSPFYIVRPSDAVALETIGRQGVTITIKGPEQIGKSSLLIRIIEAAHNAGKRVAFLDFQLIDQAALSDADRFFRQFCTWLTEVLELPDRLDEHWNIPLGNSQRCTRYLSRYLLPAINAPLVLAMDEVESIFETDFRSDFFGMLRGWHNNRATAPLWKQLDLVLVTSTEPYQLIENLNQSPFNVGRVIDLADFTTAQVADLNRRHGSCLNAAEEQRLIDLLNRHPYLTHRALYLIASGQITSADLWARATDDTGPFGDHLRNHLFRLHDKKELVQGLLQVIQSNTCSDERVFFGLRGAGLVRRDPKGAVLPRCQLYADYFRKHLQR